MAQYGTAFVTGVNDNPAILLGHDSPDTDGLRVFYELIIDINTDDFERRIHHVSGSILDRDIRAGELVGADLASINVQHSGNSGRAFRQVDRDFNFVVFACLDGCPTDYCAGFVTRVDHNPAILNRYDLVDNDRAVHRDLIAYRNGGVCRSRGWARGHDKQ